jgi:hypothetical protein
VHTARYDQVRKMLNGLMSFLRKHLSSALANPINSRRIDQANQTHQMAR